MPVSEVTPADVVDILDPIWHTRMSMARSVHRRVRSVLEWAVAMEYRTDNPCDRLLSVLGRQNHVVKRMKTRREHRVPLCGRALEILAEARALDEGTARSVFTREGGKPLRDPTLRQLVRENGIEAVPHGFRSSFRDWAAEETDHRREVVEAALAHVVKNKVEAAYRRTDLFERRRHLMNDWSAYLAAGTGA